MLEYTCRGLEFNASHRGSPGHRQRNMCAILIRTVFMLSVESRNVQPQAVEWADKMRHLRISPGFKDQDEIRSACAGRRGSEMQALRELVQHP
ncbi:MAG: hypothetical protein OIN88_13995 [Candidatus Methanoperedens sp.]|nr:hypothetical protein [Candidatus Methanoperedens sp.]